jgi:hypothetical protein
MQYTAIAQDEFRALDGRVLPNATPLIDKSEGYDELAVGIRVPLLGGKFDNEGDKWTDIFKSPGIGFELDGSFLWAVSDKVAIGVYTTLDIDVFSGKTTTVDVGFGPETIKQDNLVMTRFLVGGRIRETFGHFFMDQNMGFGLATYSSSGATSNGVKVGVIDSSVEFAFELGARFGFVVSRVVDLGMGISYNYNGAPNISSDLTQVDPSLKLDGQSNAVFFFFINLNF